MTEIGADFDWIADGETAELAQKSRELLEARFSAEAAVFKASVIAQLQREGAYHRSAGWAVYETEEEYGGSVATDGNTKKIAIIAEGSIPPRRPAVKIYSNENIVGLLGNHSILTEHAIVDEDNDAQYRVDAVVADGETIDFDSIRHPLFSLEAGRLAMVATEDIPPVSILLSSEPKSFGEAIIPFGHYYFLEHRIAALAKAQEMFKETAALALRGAYTLPTEQSQPEQSQSFMENEGRPDE